MLLGRVGLSPVMVGREAELGRLLALRPGPDPEVAFVGGEGGVGKTRLVLHELARRLAPGTPVLVGAASPGGGRPYAVLQEAVGAAVADWAELPGPLRHLAAPLAVALGPAAGRLGRQPATGPAPASEDVQRAAAELVCHLVGPSPGALVVFDDLHWADPESVAVFGRLATTAGLAALLVLHRRTGGNPFFVEELVLAAGDAEPERLADLPLPWTLTETVLRHLDGFDDEALRVVDAAAVLGRRIPFDQLAVLTGLGEDDLIGVLRLLVDRGLVVEREPDVFAFRHALTHEAVEARRPRRAGQRPAPRWGTGTTPPATPAPPSPCWRHGRGGAATRPWPSSNASPRGPARRRGRPAGSRHGSRRSPPWWPKGARTARSPPPCSSPPRRPAST